MGGPEYKEKLRQQLRLFCNHMLTYVFSSTFWMLVSGVGIGCLASGRPAMNSSAKSCFFMAGTMTLMINFAVFVQALGILGRCRRVYNKIPLNPVECNQILTNMVEYPDRSVVITAEKASARFPNMDLIRKLFLLGGIVCFLWHKKTKN